MPQTPRAWAWAAGLSAGAALTHTLAVEEHLREWWGYGIFFLFASIAQMFYAILLLLRPWRRAPPGPREDRRERAWLSAGIIGNGVLILLYLVSRTVGVPFFGPARGEVEPWTALGIVAKVFEAALVVALVRLLPPAPGAVAQSQPR